MIYSRGYNRVFDNSKKINLGDSECCCNSVYNGLNKAILVYKYGNMNI